MLKRTLIAATLAASLSACGNQSDHDHYEVKSMSELQNFMGNPLQPKERPMQSYLGREIPVFDIHLHPGTFETMGPIGQDFVLNAINVPWLPESLKRLGISLLSKLMISPYGFGIGIQEECLRAKLSYCGLFAVHAPETWGVTSNENIIKALEDKKNFKFDEQDPYFFGFATIDMQQWVDDPKMAEADLRRALEHPHIIAIKLAFIHNAWPLNDRRFDRVYELAAAYQVPVYHHVGSSPLRNLDSFATEEEKRAYLSSYDPNYLKPIIADHPNTAFILGHMGFDFTGEGNDFMPTVFEMAASFDNVYLEMSAFGKRSHDAEGTFLSSVLKRVKAEGLIDRLIYGSDGPGFPGGTKAYIEASLVALEEAGYSYDEAKAVLIDNMRRLSRLQ